MPSQTPDFEVRLKRLAETAVTVGLNLQPGQELIVTAPLEAVDLTRAIVQCAYRAGASLVTALFGDEQLELARLRHGQEAAFDGAPGWLYQGMANAFAAGAARLAITGGDPALLAGENVERIARMNRARARAYAPALKPISDFAMNWTIVAAATPAWARAVFPNLDQARATAHLWDAVFKASRVDGPDPAAAWRAHDAKLAALTQTLNAKRYHALHFRGLNMDLKVGLADGHAWAGGASRAHNGVVCNANIPTEEVFTTPHKLRVEGYVRATKPLSYMGALIEDIAVTFEQGAIVSAKAKSGEEILRKILQTDEGARRLGEVALVPHSSPISQSGLLFFNTLFDENASSHIALGQAYSKCFVDSENLSEEQLSAQGANRSLIHIDWMIGAADTDVDGLSDKGVVEPVMRAGEFVI